MPGNEKIRAKILEKSGILYFIARLSMSSTWQFISIYIVYQNKTIFWSKDTMKNLMEINQANCGSNKISTMQPFKFMYVLVNK